MQQPLIKKLGLIDYRLCQAHMHHYTLQRAITPAPCQFWILEHKPCYTLSPYKSRTHIKTKLPYPLYTSTRGGDITYHGPGQMVIYWLLDLKRRTQEVGKLAECAENFIIDWLKTFQIEAYGDLKARGVYVDGKKIASIGFKVHRHFIYHGIAINCAMDLTPFKAINPCGLHIEMTQITNHTNKPIKKWEVYKSLSQQLIKHFKLESFKPA